MKVPPKRTILIVIVKMFGTTGEDNPIKRTPLCSQYRNWTASPYDYSCFRVHLNATYWIRTSFSFPEGPPVNVN
ncbi:hypothetical protein DPMN_072593 [Dreissena polymorpha]|uniref:Uncharacterized protein n=1 Tax=Dreissena polymorpha TaxID=45954 RepID=A0A9D4BXK7_DREPO|nr:hypothetical protein DPMN_072593 [Dreissena polymorpha]